MGDTGGVFRYLQEKLVAFLEEDSRTGAIESLTELLRKEGKLPRPEEFLRSVLDREKIVSTSIGVGVAVPHARIPGNSDFFIAIGVLKKKGIDWNLSDESPVRLIFLIGGPENKQTEYLKLLSSLTLAVKDETRRKKILQCYTGREVVDLFTGC